jgi:hypothetical protein
VRHFNPRFVYFVPPFYIEERFILQNSLRTKNGNSSFSKPKIRCLYTRAVTDHEQVFSGVCTVNNFNTQGQNFNSIVCTKIQLLWTSWYYLQFIPQIQRNFKALVLLSSSQFLSDCELYSGLTIGENIRAGKTQVLDQNRETKGTRY